jgi:hypothetical protein
MHCSTDRLPLSVILCKLVREQEQLTLVHWGRVRTNLHDVL